MGDMLAKSLTIGLNKDFFTTEADFKSVFASEIRVSKLKTKTVLSPVIIPNNKLNALFINSFMKVKGQIRYDSSPSEKKQSKNTPRGTSFIQMGFENIYLNNVKQWKLVSEIDLNEVNIQFNEFINRQYIMFNSTVQEVSKEIRIPKGNFDHLSIESNFKFANFLWNNNTAYIKINEELYWMDHHSWENTDKCDDSLWSNPIKIIVPKNILKDINIIKFGMKLNQKNNNEALCPQILKIIHNKNSVTFDSLSIKTK